jgi:rod shape-determining protein MreD
MSRRFITILLLAGTLLQTVLPVWNVFGAQELPVLTGLVICIALYTDRSRMFYAAILAGFLHDSFSPAPLGMSIPFYVVMAYGINWIRAEIFGDLPSTYILFGAAAAAAENIYYAFGFWLSGYRPVPAGLFGLRLAGSLMAGAVVVPLIALPVQQLRQAVLRRQRRFAL